MITPTSIHTPSVIETLIARCSAQLLRATSDPDTFDVDLVGKLQRMLNGFLRSQTLAEKHPQPGLEPEPEAASESVHAPAAATQAPVPQESSPNIAEPHPVAPQGIGTTPEETPQTPPLSEVIDVAPNLTCVLIGNPPPPGHPALKAIPKPNPAAAPPIPRKKPKPTPGAFGRSKLKPLPTHRRPSKSERRLLKRATRK